jgi:hypothetical protein
MTAAADLAAHQGPSADEMTEETMDDEGRGKSKTVTARLAPVEHSALVRAAKRAELPVPELVSVFIRFCLERLEAGDTELLRAVKGSRDAAVR